MNDEKIKEYYLAAKAVKEAAGEEWDAALEARVAAGEKWKEVEAASTQSF